MKIGIISDTHGIYGDEFKSFLKDVDVIWHAGDFGGGIEWVRQAFKDKPLVGVYGNADGQDIRREFPYFQSFVLEGKKILIVHIGGYPHKYDLKAKALIEAHRPDIFVCGHSHILKVIYDDYYKMLVINPGAAGRQGWQVFRTAIRFEIDNGDIRDMEVFKL